MPVAPALHTAPSSPYRIPRTSPLVLLPRLSAPQVRQLFPSARGLKLTWHSIVKIGQSLYEEAPGMDRYRPDQKTPVPNFFLAGSYTKQVGAWRSFRVVLRCPSVQQR